MDHYARHTIPLQTPAQLGAAIRRVRRAAGLSQAELAMAAGTTQVTVSRIEAGKSTARLELALSLLTALGAQVYVTHPLIDDGAT